MRVEELTSYEVIEKRKIADIDSMEIGRAHV